MISSAALAALAASCFVASSALADDKQPCTDAYTKAQTFRDAHKLTRPASSSASEARAECSGFIAKDCAGWQNDVDSRIPSVVLVAKNAAGSDLIDVKVTMDGAPLVTKLDGLALDVDPGAHTFAFEAPDGKAEEKVVITEGAKAQRVAVTFGAAGTAPTVATTPGVAASTPYAVASAPGAVATPEAAWGADKIEFFPKEPVESRVSVGFRSGWGFPFGTTSGDATFGAPGNGALSKQANGQVPLWFDAGYLVSPSAQRGPVRRSLGEPVLTIA